MSLNPEQQTTAEDQPAMETTLVPSIQETRADPASTLAWIQTRIHNIYSATKHLEPDSQSITISASAYAELYGAATNYCAVTKAKPHKGGLMGEDLYYSIEREIRAYCSDIRQAIFTKWIQDMHRDVAERLLKMYMLQWDRFTKLAKLVSNLCRSLERHWIRREISEKKRDRYKIEDLHRKVWKEEILQVKQDEPLSRELQALRGAAIMLRDKAGEMTAEEMDLVQSVASALSSTDLSLDVRLEATS
ncbi:hypothetical protein QM012_006573 [Aureobasidium pullulans]|uniref:Cullin N-terminal domain-containing protein n=1 Tax=Aureobasidium pullulans TaxID=5580 RepID=A0ABR0TP09_AURPU